MAAHDTDQGQIASHVCITLGEPKQHPGWEMLVQLLMLLNALFYLWVRTYLEMSVVVHCSNVKHKGNTPQCTLTHCHALCCTASEKWWMSDLFHPYQRIISLFI